MYKRIIILLFFSICCVCIAQELWERTYGKYDDMNCAYSITQTTDGGYAIAGKSQQFGKSFSNVYCVRIDAMGDTIWNRTFSRDIDYADEGYSIKQTVDQGFIIAGYTTGLGGYSDFYLIKLNSSGYLQWDRVYGGIEEDRAFSVIQTPDSGFAIVGFTQSYGAGLYDIYLVRTNASGDTVWTRTYGGSEYDGAYSIAQTPGGGFIIGGWTWSFGEGRNDFYVVKTDFWGDTIWTRTYGGIEDDEAKSIVPTDDGGYVIVGSTRSFGEGRSDVFLVRINPEGDTLWTRTYGGSEDDKGESVIQTADSCFLIAGWTRSFSDICTHEETDVFSIKTDSWGDTIWTRTYGGKHEDYGYSVIQAADGKYITAGETWSISIDRNDAYLIKSDDFGFSGTQWYFISQGWNLFSFPFQDSLSITESFPSALSSFILNPTMRAYDIVDSINFSSGFWLFSLSDTVVAVYGSIDAASITITFYPGWNLIGGPSTGIDASILTSYGEILAPIYGFDSETNTYFDAEILCPGFAYFVRALDTLEIEFR